MSNSWHSAWRDVGVAKGDEVVHGQLIACWSEPHRHYHTMQHLSECLSQFEAVRGLAQQPGEVALALWFHDAFYDPHRSDNELRSAQWAHQSVMAAGVSVPVADRVHALVMHTRHAAVPDEADAMLLVDVDLSILGAPAPRYDEFERQVRAEYAHVPLQAFRERRSLISQSFLARSPLYHTAYFQTTREAQARANLSEAVKKLQPCAGG